jgi:hypothetical protein
MAGLGIRPGKELGLRLALIFLWPVLSHPAQNHPKITFDLRGRQDDAPSPCSTVRQAFFGQSSTTSAHFASGAEFTKIPGIDIGNARRTA